MVLEQKEEVIWALVAQVAEAQVSRPTLGLAQRRTGGPPM